MSREPNCTECRFMKMYDYGSRIYYCDNEDRSDYVGKLSMGDLPEGSPEWCPLRENNTPQNFGE